MDRFRVADVVGAEDLRGINLALYHADPASYFHGFPPWSRPETLGAIQSCTGATLHALLQAVPACALQRDALGENWAHHMAVHAGFHPWPNANHRTAFAAFNLALERSCGWHASFPTAALHEDLVARSKSQRDSDGGEYTLAELAKPELPYRRLFSRAALDLVIVPAS